MRGKHFFARHPQPPARITPADAGKTGKIVVVVTTPTDHPRGCGENKTFGSLPSKRSGSPPRMRGKPAQILAGQTSEGITPADAGKTIL